MCIYIYIYTRTKTLVALPAQSTMLCYWLPLLKHGPNDPTVLKTLATGWEQVMHVCNVADVFRILNLCSVA